ncbi:spore gernimation protein [Hazenella sp. IB182357]|uniref:Spore gernimation protein n=1 Tax=Polycladospora coralii TaxID=2771432 RepID=A0A926RUD3_9BACL|nr:spore gernimation protein [Polycladospora coralii]MBD1373800.1 spore gernimation protein [Polycladospora coralii]MBS7531548.1 spore gernimation protein [Polycladospora coralii]
MGINNFYNVRLDVISAGSSLNSGSTSNIGAESKNKSLGGSSPIGDFVRNGDFECNCFLDIDLVDQSQPRVI